MYLLFAYITGGLIILIALFNFAFPYRRLSLILKASIDFVTILNLLFILLETKNYEILVGIVSTCIGLLRDIVFMFRIRCKQLDHLYVPIFFCVLFSCSLIFTYKSPISLLPVIGSLFSTMTLFAIDQRYTKAGAMICTCLYTIYYAVLLPGSDILTVFSLVSSAAGCVGATIGLFILLKKMKKNRDEAKNLS